MHIVFFCIPAHGHTNPTLGVVKELIAQGHQVTYFSYECMREKIEATGARYISCNQYDCEQSLSEQDRTRIGKDVAFSMRVLVDTTLALDEPVCKELKEIKPDCIVVDSMALWGKAAAMKLGIPLVMSNTTFVFNKESAQIMKTSVKGLLKDMAGLMKAGKDVKRLRAAGYPFKNALEIIQTDESASTIVYTSRYFQPASETFGDNFAFVGPSIRPIETPFEKTREKLVYVSLGTVNNSNVDFYRECVQAFCEETYQVVITVGNLVDLNAFGGVPEHITIAPMVDQMAVLSQADVFISHCGMNSVNEALSFGVPLVTVPQTSEQTGVATRAEQLGAALRLTDMTADQIREAVNEVLGDESYARSAEKIGESFRQCSGVKGAVDVILSKARA